MCMLGFDKPRWTAGTAAQTRLLTVSGWTTVPAVWVDELPKERMATNLEGGESADFAVEFDRDSVTSDKVRFSVVFTTSPFIVEVELGIRTSPNIVGVGEGLL